MGGCAFAGLYVEVFGVGDQACSFCGKTDQGHSAQHGDQAADVCAVDQCYWQQEQPQQQAAQAEHGAEEGGDDLPVVPEGAGLDAVAFVHVPQANQASDGGESTGNLGEDFHKAPLQPDVYQLKEGEGSQTGEEQGHAQAFAGYR